MTANILLLLTPLHVKADRLEKRLLKQFLDWKITLMVHWGSVFLKQLYNLDLKFKENWIKKGTIKTSFLGTVIIILLGT